MSLEKLYFAYYGENLFAVSTAKSYIKTYVKHTRQIPKEERVIRSTMVESDLIFHMYEPYLLQEWHGWILTTEDIAIIQAGLRDTLMEFDRVSNFLLEYRRRLQIIGEEPSTGSIPLKRSMRALILMNPLFGCDMESYFRIHQEYRELQCSLFRFELER